MNNYLNSLNLDTIDPDLIFSDESSDESIPEVLENNNEWAEDTASDDSEESLIDENHSEEIVPEPPKPCIGFGCLLDNTEAWISDNKYFCAEEILSSLKPIPPKITKLREEKISEAPAGRMYSLDYMHFVKTTMDKGKISMDLLVPPKFNNEGNVTEVSTPFYNFVFDCKFLTKSKKDEQAIVDVFTTGYFSNSRRIRRVCFEKEIEAQILEGPDSEVIPGYKRYNTICPTDCVIYTGERDFKFTPEDDEYTYFNGKVINLERWSWVFNENHTLKLFPSSIYKVEGVNDLSHPKSRVFNFKPYMVDRSRGHSIVEFKNEFRYKSYNNFFRFGYKLVNNISIWPFIASDDFSAKFQLPQAKLIIRYATSGMKHLDFEHISEALQWGEEMYQLGLPHAISIPINELLKSRRRERERKHRKVNFKFDFKIDDIVITTPKKMENCPFSYRVFREWLLHSSLEYVSRVVWYLRDDFSLCIDKERGKDKETFYLRYSETEYEDDE